MASEAMLEAVGPAVRATLPLVITRKGAMTTEVFDYVHSLASKGVSFSKIAASLSELNHSSYWKACHKYYLIARARDIALKKWKSKSLHANNDQVKIDVPPAFNTIDDKVRMREEGIEHLLIHFPPLTCT